MYPAFFTVLLSIFTFILAYYITSKRYNTILFQEESSNENIIGLILEFENWENDLLLTVSNLCQTIPHVVIYTETFIYPPIDFTKIRNCQIDLIEKRRSVHNSWDLLKFVSKIKISKYIMVIPDSTRLIFNPKVKFVDYFVDEKSDGFWLPIHSETNSNFNITCKNFNFNVKKWTLQYDDSVHGTCDYEENFILLIKTELFLQLFEPFSYRPFMKSFIIQSNIVRLNIKLLQISLFQRGTKLFTTERSHSKKLQFNNYRIKKLFQDLGIKKVENRNHNLTEWFGCNRNTARCFGTIYNDQPDYLLQNRWLPPCCRNNLEQVGRYVFDILDRFEVRYWLEGGSLLGAARNGEIIEWDYDIDIGIYREDSKKFPILDRLLYAEPGSSVVDGQGFQWEKAIDGDYLKIHFSQTNRIHVDIFPFEPVDGTMTKKTWFENHPQDMPFPEHYLRPLTKIKFIGVEVWAPNNITKFLEMKFGSGAIENPKYPGN